MKENVVLACSVRHRFGASWHARSAGTDEIHLPNLSNFRVELIRDGEVWSAIGAELAEETNPIVVRWWFSGGQAVSYALLVHASIDPIDADRFIDIDSAGGSSKEFDFGRWQFRSRW
ncbi:MAG: hypothetical protein KIT84_40475 [Labilithrix sp.]|nr:hypothetical protein [Labilithrix sp.]MCW5817344.1 hypothetical protein [Labilithrix sp.]